MRITSQLKAWLQATNNGGAAGTDTLISDEEADRLASAMLQSGALTPKKLESLTRPAIAPGGQGSGNSGAVKDKNMVTSKSLLSGIHVHGAGESYSTTKAIGKHKRTGMPVEGPSGKPVELPSQLELAKAGVLFRYLALRSGMTIRPLDDHERNLLQDCYRDAWCGEIGNEHHAFVPGAEVKAMLDESSGSQGLVLVPIWFDEMITTFPLLNSELMPYVDIRDMPRSNRVESGSLGNPTVTWNQAEGTGLTLFDTTALAAAINTSTFPIMVGVECGRDWLSDSPIELGSVLVQNVGQRMLAELDKVIATGDGTTQPQGVTNASGTTAVSSDNGAGGPPTVSDAESLIFGVGKQYRLPSWNPSFIMSDVCYRRFRGIQVAPSDERRVFGMDEQSYTLLGYPVRISNDMANSKAAFMPLKKYRLYRRSGSEVRWTQEGQTLALKNTALLVVRGRFGGKVMDGNAVAIMSDLQS